MSEQQNDSSDVGRAQDETEVRASSLPHDSAQAANVRFTPGSMLADRYRIVALLGKGGMGEVYRAEDVKLGQQVALKFLPGRFAEDRAKLQRLYDEVRLGRQVSHPNVCRMYDVADWQGHHFIAMEYIDGEDLSSLLRRIGKLPHDKALDIARDLCAGLAAAHGLGIIHRDLKPANVMIDGRGDARITDFGLAALAEDLEQRREVAGTPAYMAPEQLSGGQVTQKTDLYALGLILYEMFTGRRLFEASTLGEIISQQKASSSQSLPKQTADLDPAVQRVIIRCLDHDPARRPASIHSVIAALPGGDPLQAAIEAGETPSPEMLAAAGASGELRPMVAWPLLILTIVMIFAAAALSPRVRLYGRIPLPLGLDELTFRARQIIVAQGGVSRPGDSVRDFDVDADYRAAIRRQRLNRNAPPLADSRVSPILFAYRESPRMIRPAAPGDRTEAAGTIPPHDEPGMAQVILEPDGRLRKLVMVPAETGVARPAPDYAALFTAAGLDLTTARPVAPRWRAPIGSDTRAAWEIAGKSGAKPLRVEAASFAGRVTWFEVIAPWRLPKEVAAAPTPPGQRVGGVMSLSLLLSSLVIGGLLAFRNFRRGRVDRRGSIHLAVVVFAMFALASIFYADHHAAPGAEFEVLLLIVASSLNAAAFCWLWYAALEPYLRRRWPKTLIAWSRVLQGRLLDSLVGRHLLIGILGGASIAVIRLAGRLIPERMGWAAPTPTDVNFLELSGWRFTIATAMQSVPNAIFLALLNCFMLLLIHLLVRRRVVAVAIFFTMVILSNPYENYPEFAWSVRIIVAAIVVTLIVRYGLLAFAAASLASFMFTQFPPTFDTSAWYFANGLVPIVVLIALATFGFVRSVGAGALFAEPVLED